MAFQQFVTADNDEILNPVAHDAANEMIAEALKGLYGRATQGERAKRFAVETIFTKLW
jgi:hypothetical protein